MAVAGAVVEPGGINLLRLLFGIPEGDPGPGAAGALGGLFGGQQGGMFADFAKGYRKGLGGGYVAPNPYLDFAMDPNAKNGVTQRLNNHDEDWAQWFETGLKDGMAPGIDLPSLFQTTGQRTARNFGGFDYANNRPTSAQDTSMYTQLFGQRDPKTGQKTWGSMDLYTDPSTRMGEYVDPKNWGARMDAPGTNYQSAINKDEYNRPGRWVDDYIGTAAAPGINMWRQNEWQNAASPTAAVNDYFGLLDRRKQEGYDPIAIARKGIRMGTGYDDQAVSSLNRSIDEEAQRSLALQLPEVRQQAQMLGLTDGAASQRLGGDVASDILGSSARHKADVMAQYQDSAAQRRNQLIGNYQTIGAAAGGDVLQGAGNMYGRAYDARENAMNMLYGAADRAIGRGQEASYGARSQMARDIFGAKAQAMQAGMQANMDRGNRMMGIEADILNAGNQDITNRMIAESNAQSQAMRDYMALKADKEAQYQTRLNQYLGLGGEQQALLQQKLNQEAQYSQMPMNWLMQLVTGTSPAQAPQGGGFNWGGLLGGLIPAGVDYVRGLNAGSGTNQNPPPRTSYDGYGPT
jgi:hypothetical protein